MQHYDFHPLFLEKVKISTQSLKIVLMNGQSESLGRRNLSSDKIGRCSLTNTKHSGVEYRGVAEEIQTSDWNQLIKWHTKKMRDEFEGPGGIIRVFLEVLGWNLDWIVKPLYISARWAKPSSLLKHTSWYRREGQAKTGRRKAWETCSFMFRIIDINDNEAGSV